MSSISNARQYRSTSGVRRALRRDLSVIVEIENASFHAPWPRGLLRRELGRPGFFVYEEDGQVCGYIITRLRRPPPWAWLERRLWPRSEEARILLLPSGHVMNLAVAPAYRRRGIARALLELGSNHLRQHQAHYVDLEVRVANEAAIRLYQAFGFQIIARLPHYYQTDEDAYLMRWWFQTTASLDKTNGPR
jgi:ribosomal-protein-alanine N-acetyltransferase